MHRIHRAANGCWHFAYDGRGRFDPVRSRGFGACYFGEEDLATWVEVFRTRKTVAWGDVDVRRLSTIELDAGLEVLDLTARRSLTKGVTNAVAHSNRYESAQALAARAADDGMLGVRWIAKHDPAARLHAVALFGPREPADPEAGRPVPHSRAIPPTLISKAKLEFGYDVLPSP